MIVTGGSGITKMVVLPSLVYILVDVFVVSCCVKVKADGVRS